MPESFKKLGARVEPFGADPDCTTHRSDWPALSKLPRFVLSHLQRLMTRAHGVRYDDPKPTENPKQTLLYFCAKISWLVIDKTGMNRAAKMVPPDRQIVAAEILQVLDTLK